MARMGKESLFHHLNCFPPFPIMALKIKWQWGIRFVQTKNLQCTRASNIKNKDCIFYFLSKTLKCLLKHLPSKQEKTDSVMKGEMIMSSPVNGIQPTRTMHSNRFAGHSEWSFKHSSPLHLLTRACSGVSLWMGASDHFRQMEETCTSYYQSNFATVEIGKGDGGKNHHHNLARQNWWNTLRVGRDNSRECKWRLVNYKSTI